ncbi:Protein of unknown function [Gryllus bimaculatus]|nr:Protein of unknown function [Gryllus bimaculatus]
MRRDVAQLLGGRAPQVIPSRLPDGQLVFLLPQPLRAAAAAAAQHHQLEGGGAAAAAAAAAGAAGVALARRLRALDATPTPRPARAARGLAPAPPPPPQPQPPRSPWRAAIDFTVARCKSVEAPEARQTATSTRRRASGAAACPPPVLASRPPSIGRCRSAARAPRRSRPLRFPRRNCALCAFRSLSGRHADGQRRQPARTHRRRADPKRRDAALLTRR